MRFRELAPAFLLALACAAPWAAHAQRPVLTESDRAVIRMVIQRQIDAFRRDDAPAAFALTSPGIQARFGTAERFLAMVRESYQPVYRPRQVVFLEAVVAQGQVMQRVLVTGPDGVPVMAVYPMARLPDGSWATDGCVLVALPSTSA